MKRLKVVWLCHFSNEEIQNILHPRRRVNEYAPWMFISLKIAEKEQRFDLHVVAPHEYISGVKEFDLRGVHYHFFNPYMPLYGRHWPSFFKWDYLTNYRKNKKKVSELVKRIHPDVIHLFGAENAYYSSTILPLIPCCPTILTVQGFISHTHIVKKNKVLQGKIDVEQEILRKMYISFYETKKQAEDIKKYNPKIELIYNSYGSYKIDPIPCSTLKYDICFFARVCKDKGIVDLLKAVQIIKKDLPHVSLCVIGGKSVEFQQLSIEMGLDDNVIWAGFLPTRRDVHVLASQAKVSVLPTYHDIIPGTIIESMFLGIPVVSYNTDSIPEINEKGEVIKLVEKGDISDLANSIKEIILNDSLRNVMRERGIKRAHEMFAPSDDYTVNQWLKGYQRAIELYQQYR